MLQSRWDDTNSCNFKSPNDLLRSQNGGKVEIARRHTLGYVPNDPADEIELGVTAESSNYGLYRERR
jgi:hypothetical protein